MRRFLPAWIAILTLHSSLGFAQVKLEKSNLPIFSVTLDQGSILNRNTDVPASYQLRANATGKDNTLSDQPSLSGRLGIRYRGKSSFDLSDKKPYSIEFLDAKGEEQDVAILGMPAHSDWALIGPFADKSLIRDAVLYRLGQQIMPWAPKYRFVDVQVDGQYKGIFMLTERIKRNKVRVNINKIGTKDTTGQKVTGGYIIALDKLDPGDITFRSAFPMPGKTYPPDYRVVYPNEEDLRPSQLQYIKDHVRAFERVMDSPTFNDPKEGYAKWIDVPSFVDMVLLNELSKNVDGYRLSAYFYKDNDAINSKIFAGPIWDYNLAFGNANYCRGEYYVGWAYDFNKVCPEDYWVIHFWWDKLINDPAFRVKMKKRWFELRKNVFATDRVLGHIDSLANVIGPAQTLNFQLYPILNKAVWPNSYVGGTYANEITFLKDWTRNRITWLDAAMAEIPDRVSNVAFGEVKLYPNPGRESVTFEYRLAGLGETVELLIVDASGREVYSFSKKYIGSGPQILPLDISRFSPGIYFYKLKPGNGAPITGRLVRQ
ncbi:CotH kinase family protein [Haliscomenobacter sp.]|uniref:CotH kinase family protein n=1 Tax=Haliscomenobacter sp. TaxID=2717303 RepID=UPI003BAD5B04